MKQEEFERRLNVVGTDLWTACQLSLESMNKDLVSVNVTNILENLKQYIELTKDEVIGRLEKISALSGYLDLSEKEINKLESMKESIHSVGVYCSSVDEYIIDACTLTDINERLREVL